MTSLSLSLQQFLLIRKAPFSPSSLKHSHYLVSLTPTLIISVSHTVSLTPSLSLTYDNSLSPRTLFLCLSFSHMITLSLSFWLFIQFPVEIFFPVSIPSAIVKQEINKINKKRNRERKDEIEQKWSIELKFRINLERKKVAKKRHKGGGVTKCITRKT